MANYSVLKAAVEAVVKTNGNEEITGANLQSTLELIIDSLGAGYQFVGIATPSTSPGTPDQRVFYIAGEGSYSNFGTSYSVGKGYIGVFSWGSSAWSKTAVKICAVPLTVQNNIPVNYQSTQKLSTSLKKVFYAEEMQVIIRNKNITDIIVDCCTLGTFSVITASKDDVNAMTATVDELYVNVVETFTLQHYGWQKLHLSTPLLVDGDTSLGFFDSTDTAQTGYCLTGTTGHCDFVAPYSSWYFGKRAVYDSDYKLNIGVLTKEGEYDYHPIEDSVIGGYSLGSDATYTNSTPMFPRGGFFLAENVQADLRGKTITHVRVNATATGIMRVVVGTWTNNSYSTAWFEMSETIVVNELGWHTYKLQKPVVLGANDRIGFNGDDTFTVLCTDNKINSIYNSQYGFQFFSGTTLTNGYWCGFEAIVENSEAVRSSEIYRPTKLCGKKVIIYGDSISSYNGLIPAGYEYFYPTGDVDSWFYTWWGVLALLQSLVMSANNGGGSYTYYNRSWSGSKVCNLQGGDKPFCSTARLSSLPSPDVILFFGGINDLAGGTPHPVLGDEPTWGNMATMDLSEFRGAYAYCIEYLLTNYKDARLICMTPTPINILGHFTDNDKGVSYGDICDAIREVCTKYGVSLIDMSRCPLTYLNASDYTLDGVHPNKAGMKLLGEYVNAQINSLM